MRRFFVALFCTVALAFAEPRATHVAISSRTGVTADKLTIQQSQSQPQPVFPVSAVVLSTVAGTVRVEHSGTAPTTTAATPSPTISGGSASSILAYTNSNVGAGTVASVTYTLQAGVPLTLDMSTMAFSGSGATKNITVVVALGSSGDVQTALYWKEGQ
ncbi:MAG: hypothetical protein ABFD89_13195 [Bryobacteraceae bacterium]|jgi:hypothetical protein